MSSNTTESPSDKKRYLWTDSFLGDIILVREMFRDKETGNWRTNFMDTGDVINILSQAIERELKRRVEPKQEKPADKYPVNDPIYQWFCYYQDKCRDLERKLENRDIQSDIGNTVFGV
jgi:hypothetical protein